MHSLRKWDNGEDEVAYTSSDEDEFSKLKPNKDKSAGGKMGRNGSHNNSSSGRGSGSSGSGERGSKSGGSSRLHSNRGQRGQRQTEGGRNASYFLASAASGATSPNDSDNTYAEASLLHHPTSGGQPQHHMRYDQGRTTLLTNKFYCCKLLLRCIFYKTPI